MADALKAQGNAAFSAGNFEEAISFFTQAVELDPSNHVLYSNRSASYASLKQYKQALDDAKKCVELKPDWAKGFSRLGAAQYGLGLYDEAIEAYEQGLTLDASNEQMQTALADARQAAAKAHSPFGPQLLARLATDARTRPFLGQPDFMRMLADLQNNPQAMGTYLRDPRFQLVLEVGLGLKMGAAGDEDMADSAATEPSAAEPHANGAPAAAASHAPPPSAPPRDAPTQQAPPPPPPPAPEVEMSEEEQQAAAAKAEAAKEKELGNEAYKKKDFETAIRHYNRAIELNGEDISFLTNKAAVYFEMGRYEDCVADCDAAVEKGRELRADYKIVARALTRKGNALAKLDRLEEAIAAFNKSLTEHRNADTLKRLNETEKQLKERKEKEYINMGLCDEEREKGNTSFKEQKYPDAIKHYNEALKRGPPAVNPEAYKIYSNLAACYTKLGAYPEGVKAADKCIELCPTFAKGYSRKAACQYFMKEYDKAMDTYRKGLEFDKENEEMREGMERCYTAISKMASGDATPEEIKERQARAMQDPEVQNILRDPVMNQVLKDFQENPKYAQQHMRNPDIMAKLQKLISAGIIQVR